LIRSVMDDVEAFAEGCEQFDDITCVAALLR
jgi:serine phosphatase RsbU (regulator of sigma subunit)